MKRQQGFTLVELMVAILITGTSMVALINLLPVLSDTADSAHEIATAVGLARLLIEETDLLPFEDPAANCTFGVESDESDASRADFDDVDDYDGYSDQPPQDKQGNPDTEYAEYKRSVEVVNLDTSDLSTVRTDGSTDAKLVTVTVTRRGRTVTSLSVIRFYGANRSDEPLLLETITCTDGL